MLANTKSQAIQQMGYGGQVVYTEPNATGHQLYPYSNMNDSDMSR